MKLYYLHDGQNQIGPFSPEELKQKNITRETYVWKEGLPDWAKAGEMSELNNLFANTPPPFKAAATNIPATPVLISQKPNASGTEKTGMWIGRNPKLALLILALLVIGGIAIYNARQSQNYSSGSGIFEPTVRDKTPEELRRELEQKEKENPQLYLTGRISMRKNLIGEKVFEGTITNTANTAAFKDVVLEITYMSKTSSAIGSEKFTVYEIIKPQQTISIKKIKTFAPAGTENVLCSISSALPLE